MKKNLMGNQMPTKNKESTRYYSNQQETQVCKILNAVKQANSGAGKFAAGDCYNKSASLLIECKTCMTEKDSISIKKEWIEKLEEERKIKRLANKMLAFSFGPESKNYFVIDEKLASFLIEKLEEENI